MKTILVGVDFTKSSDNTINYAIEIAKKSEAKILLFHALAAPVVHTTSGLVFMDGENFVKGEEKRMKDLQIQLSKKHSSVKFDIELTYESIREKIDKLSKKNKISLAVLGLETKSKISKFIYGTTSANLTGKIDCPIITVPEKYKYHQLKKIIVAIDNKEKINSHLSKRIHSVVKFLNVVVEYVHIKTEDELELGEKNRHPFPITNIKSSNFQDGISIYAKKSKTDAIMLISHNYSSFHNLFIDSNSKKIILSSNIPVISIHK
jgi:nucleotide-binding universal stress UspA family protein